MQNDCAFLHDGYTRKGFIGAVPGLFPEIRFTFRPMLTQDRSVMTDRLTKAKPEMADRISAEAVAARISEWDVTDSRGELVPISMANVLRLQPSALGRLFAIVTGTLPTDIDPEWSAGEQEAEADEQLRFAISGTRPEEADTKN